MTTTISNSTTSNSAIGPMAEILFLQLAMQDHPRGSRERIDLAKQRNRLVLDASNDQRRTLRKVCEGLGLLCSRGE